MVWQFVPNTSSNDRKLCMTYSSKALALVLFCNVYFTIWPIIGCSFFWKIWKPWESRNSKAVREILECQNCGKWESGKSYGFLSCRRKFLFSRQLFVWWFHVLGELQLLWQSEWRSFVCFLYFGEAENLLWKAGEFVPYGKRQCLITTRLLWKGVASIHNSSELPIFVN